MTRRILLLAVCFLMTSALMAATVSKEQAQQAAAAFLQKRMANGDGPRRAAGTTPQLTMAAQVSGLYVFNVNSEDGFILVSNDDRTETILGYADSGSFDADDIPDNMRSWLQAYAGAISQLPVGASVRRAGAVNAKKAVAPLLATKWNQGEPFNNMCPLFLNTGDRCVTGCVATAMAQLMYYHKHPQQVMADIPEYECATNWSGYGKIKVDGVAAGTSFDWNNMLPVYDGSEEEAQNNAVALLMKCCGAAVSMNYANSTNGGSSASNYNAVKALVSKFGYSSEAQYLSRSNCSYDEWLEQIYLELSAQRPVLFGGQSIDGGHSFLVDGYSEDDFFHVNWGWGGTSNGYYRVSMMNPDEQGIGGSSTNSAYSMGQEIGIGICPATGTEEEPAAALTISKIGLDDSWATTSTSPLTSNGYAVTPRAAFYNMTGAVGTFDHGVRIVKDDGTFQKDYVWGTNLNLGINYGYPSISRQILLNPAGDAAITDGTYKLYFISKVSTVDTWQLDENSESYYILLTIADKQLTASVPTVTLTVNSVTFSDEQATVNVPYYITLNITNSGSKAYHGDIVMRLTGYTNKLAGVNCDIEAGETKDVKLTYTATSAKTVDVTITADETDTELHTCSITSVSATATAADISVVSCELTTGGTGTYSYPGTNYGTLVHGVLTLKNGADEEYTGGIRIMPLEHQGSGSFRGSNKTDIPVVVPAGSSAEVAFDLNLDYDILYWPKFYYPSTGGEISAPDYFFQCVPGIVTHHVDGTISASAADAAYTAPADAQVVDFSGLPTIPTVTASENPNCLYIVGEGKTLPGVSDNVIAGATADKVALQDNANGFVTTQDFTASEIAYTRTFDKFYTKGDGWTTIVVPFDVDEISNSEGRLQWVGADKKFWLYQFIGEDGDDVVFAEAPEKLEANTPYILALPGANYGAYSLEGKAELTFKCTNASVKADAKAVATGSNYKFSGTYTTTASLDDIYALNDEGNLFKKGSYSVAPFRAYFAPTSTGSNCTSLGIKFGTRGTTALDNIVSQSPLGNAQYYNLNGQRVSHPVKGLYIVNGKKVIIK